MGLLSDLSKSGLTLRQIQAFAEVSGQLPIAVSGELTHATDGQGGTVIGYDGLRIDWDIRLMVVLEPGAGDSWTDLPDARYYVAPAFPRPDAGDQLSPAGDGRSSENFYVATNLSEWKDGGGTHLLDGNTSVLVFHLYTAEWGDFYVFDRAIDHTCTVKITAGPGSSDAAGEYKNAVIMTGSATGMPPAGMMAGADCVVENAAEQNLGNVAGKTVNPHWLPSGWTGPGTLVGLTADTPPKPRVSICAPNPYATFQVALTTDGGDNATGATATATYTYTVKDLNGQTLGAAVSPVWARPQGILQGAATNGLGYYGNGGGFLLATTDEQPLLVTCQTT